MNPTSTNAKGSGYTKTHPALDYAVAIGTGLVAVKSGKFVDIDQNTRKIRGNMNNTQNWPRYMPGKQNSGNVINIDHGKGEVTSYLHDSPFDVSKLKGKTVKQGEVFAKSGHNGWSTGPHLHFEVWRNGARINPQPWLKAIKKETPVKDKKAHDLGTEVYRSCLHKEPPTYNKAVTMGKRFQDSKGAVTRSSLLAGLKYIRTTATWKAQHKKIKES